MKEEQKFQKVISRHNNRWGYQKYKSKKGQKKIDIDLDDPEVDKAVLKIQYIFLGHKARKDVGKMKNKARIREIPKEGEDIEIFLGDPEVDLENAVKF